MSNFLQNKEHIHFIGIGGSGMYPLAQILNGKGYLLSGSDNNLTDTVTAVRQLGINVTIGHKAENVKDADLVIYSAAIAKNNIELLAAKTLGIPCKERSELLGLITTWYKKAICVSGTHGKTTTSSMITHILLAEGIDISAVIGGKLPIIGGSGIVGNSEFMVCEACEFVDTFLKLSPNISIILNIDHDHLDYFKTMEHLKQSFTQFCNNTDGTIIYNGDDKDTCEAVTASTFAGKKVTFGIESSNNYYPLNIKKVTDFETSFDLSYNGNIVRDIHIEVPGKHNVLNAVAAAAGALETGCSEVSVISGLSQFHGANRRFQILSEINGITVADDYGHHPTEIAATLHTAKAMSYKRIIAVHQPFTYSRTAMFLDDFANALSIADKVILTDIMGGREENTVNVHIEDLASKISSATFFKTFDEVAEYASNFAKSGDLIITLGCGDVNKVANLIIERLQSK